MKKKMLYKTWIILFIIFTSFNIYGIEPPTIYSKAAIAIEVNTGTVLLDKNMTKKVYPASITKILTAILTLENVSLDKEVVVSKTAIKVPWDSSTVNLKAGEIMTIRDLLYCLLLNSGNDAANVLAEAVSGSIDNFVKLMNLKATELGCTGSNFVNAHGYSHDDHYTTPLDIATIFNYCIKNEEFLKIISTKTYTVAKTNKTDKERKLSNTNRLIQTKEDNKHARYYEYAIGGKTGYTHEAGRTLVTLGEKDGKKVILAVFKGKDVNGEDIRYTDAINIFNYSFDNYEYRTFANINDYTFKYINYENNLKYDLILDDKLELLMAKDDVIKNVTYTLDIDNKKLDLFTKQSYFQNAVAGKITFTINSDSQSYTATYDLHLNKINTFSIVKPNEFLTTIIIGIILLVLIICIFAKVSKAKKKKDFASRKVRRTNVK